MKQRKIVVRQDELFGDILIESAPPVPSSADGAATSEGVSDDTEPSFIDP